METTSTKSSTETTISVPEKLYKYLTSTAKANSSTEEEYIQQLIQLTLATANNPRKQTLTTAVTAYAESQTVLRERFEFAREVTQNTIRKFPASDVPPILHKLAYSPYSMGGIIKDKPQLASWDKPGTAIDITSAIANGSEKITPANQYLLVKLNGNEPETFRMPLSWLQNDPMLVAQAVRKLIRKYRLEKASATVKTLTEEQKTLTAQQENLAERVEKAQKAKAKHDAYEEYKKNGRQKAKV